MISEKLPRVSRTFEPYGDEFYRAQSEGSLQSARLVIPLALNIMRPLSVADVGCGVGTWLRACQENGLTDIHGFDGPHINPALLEISHDCFTSVDLREPFAVARKYDLAMCLEVGEHLPSSSAPGLIASLTALAPAILFSAAIPHQHGTNHVNEQWPEYWEKLFAQHGFRRLDPIRRLIWQDHRIEPWYRQNIFLYVDDTLLLGSRTLREELAIADGGGVTVVQKAVLDYYTRFDYGAGLAREFVRKILQKLRLTSGRQTDV